MSYWPESKDYQREVTVSDTPLTDAELRRIAEWSKFPLAPDPDIKFVNADFARTLERHLKAAEQHITEWLCDTCRTIYPPLKGFDLSCRTEGCQGLLRPSSVSLRAAEEERDDALDDARRLQDKIDYLEAKIAAESALAEAREKHEQERLVLAKARDLVAHENGELAAMLAEARERIATLERALHELYQALRQRHHGRMPSEVEVAYNAAHAALAGTPSAEPPNISSAIPPKAYKAALRRVVTQHDKFASGDGTAADWNSAIDAARALVADQQE